MDRTSINLHVLTKSGGRVQDGAFRGMQILPEACWGDGDLTPKLLGVYEEELTGIIEQICQTRYDAIVNIGCAEGYYSVGFALRCPSVPVYAFDSDANAALLLQKNAAVNGVAARIQVGGVCGPADIIALAQKHPRLLILCDCEGYETTLFSDPALIAALGESDVLVECHDFMDPNCTPIVFAALWKTHLIDILYSGGRDPNRFPMLARYGDLERWVAICENRPTLMNWLYCRAK